MTRWITLAAGAVILAGLAAPVQAEPVRLTDNEMAAVTAGAGSGITGYPSLDQLLTSVGPIPSYPSLDELLDPVGPIQAYPSLDEWLARGDAIQLPDLPYPIYPGNPYLLDPAYPARPPLLIYDEIIPGWTDSLARSIGGYDLSIND